MKASIYVRSSKSISGWHPTIWGCLVGVVLLKFAFSFLICFFDGPPTTTLPTIQTDELIVELNDGIVILIFSELLRFG